MDSVIIKNLKKEIEIIERNVISDYIMLNKKDIKEIIELSENLMKENTKKTEFIGAKNMIAEYMDWRRNNE